MLVCESFSRVDIEHLAAASNFKYHRIVNAMISLRRAARTNLFVTLCIHDTKAKNDFSGFKPFRKKRNTPPRGSLLRILSESSMAADPERRGEGNNLMYNNREPQLKNYLFNF